MSVRVSRSLFSLRRYLLFFALVSFLVTHIGFWNIVSERSRNAIYKIVVTS